MYHPVPSSFFFLEWQDLWVFCHLVPYKKKTVLKKVTKLLSLEYALPAVLALDTVMNRSIRKEHS